MKLIRSTLDWLADRLVARLEAPRDYLPAVDGAQPRDERGRFIEGYVRWQRPGGGQRWIWWPRAE